MGAPNHLLEFVDLVKRMRHAQSQHRRGVGELVNVQRLESDVDQAIRGIEAEAKRSGQTTEQDRP